MKHFILETVKVNYQEYSDIMNMNYDDAKKILDSLDFENISIIRTTK